LHSTQQRKKFNAEFICFKETILQSLLLILFRSHTRAQIGECITFDIVEKQTGKVKIACLELRISILKIKHVILLNSRIE
jgi:hypothetical protein